jgi:PAS domain S-box-containing protein
MLSQLKRARLAEQERAELLQQRITLEEQAKAGKRLREIEQRYQALLDNSATIIFIKDAAGRYLQVNRWFERVFKVSEHEILGKTDAEIFPGPIAEQFRAHDRQVFETGRPLEIEEVAPHDDGLHTYISNKFPLRNADGVIEALAGLSTDITERKQAELASRRLAAIVESSDDAIVSKDLNGIITSWNQAAERMFGYKPHEVIGQPVTMLMPPDRVNEEPGILNRIRHGERVDHYETVRCHKNGSLLELSLTVSPIKDHSGKIVGASKIARDISDRKRNERQQLALYDLVATVNRTTSLSDIYTAGLNAIRAV